MKNSNKKKERTNERRKLLKQIQKQQNNGRSKEDLCSKRGIQTQS